MTEKDFANMPIDKLKAYYEELTVKLSNVQRNLAVQKITENRFRESKTSKAVVNEQRIICLQKQERELLAECEAVSWYLRNRQRH